jgi:DNA-binding transcriptional ArsR family regulator
MEKQNVISALAALAQDTRLDVFRLLVRAGPEGLAAGAIADALDLPSATLSFHLKELRNAGLALCERSGRSLIYRPDCAAVEDILRYLTEHCCEGVAVKKTRRGRANQSEEKAR